MLGQARVKVGALVGGLDHVPAVHRELGHLLAGTAAQRGLPADRRDWPVQVCGPSTASASMLDRA